MGKSTALSVQDATEFIASIGQRVVLIDRAALYSTPDRVAYQLRVLNRGRIRARDAMRRRFSSLAELHHGIPVREACPILDNLEAGSWHEWSLAFSEQLLKTLLARLDPDTLQAVQLGAEIRDIEQALIERQWKGVQDIIGSYADVFLGGKDCTLYHRVLKEREGLLARSLEFDHVVEGDGPMAAELSKSPHGDRRGRREIPESDPTRAFSPRKVPDTGKYLQEALRRHFDRKRSAK